VALLTVETEVMGTQREQMIGILDPSLETSWKLSIYKNAFWLGLVKIKQNFTLIQQFIIYMK
jgi:hypothetical protein